MSFLVKEKSFYKNIFTIAIPIALQNLISFSINLLDTVMLGNADDTGTLLSAASLANQPFFVLSLVCFGLSGAATVLSAQYWGKKDMQSIRVIFSMVVKIALGFSVLFALATIFAPEFVMGLYTNDPLVAEKGAQYLKIIGFSYVIFGMTNTMICAIRCVEIVKISVVVNLASLCTNGFLNYCLIFGKFGFPQMGIRGAALATVIARLAEFVVFYIYIFIIEKNLRFRPRDLLRFNKLLFTDLIRYGLPVFINETVWGLGMTLQASLLGHIAYSSGDPVAANSIASMVQQLAMIVIFGIANAAAVMVGKKIGEGDIPQAKKRAYTLNIISVLIGLAAGGIVLLVKPVALSFYNIPEQTKLLADQLLNIIALVTVFSSVCSIGIVGIFRGAGDTKFCLAIEMVALWGVALPCAYIAAFVFNLPVPVVLLFMKIDEPLKSVICQIRLKGNKWIKNVTR